MNELWVKSGLRKKKRRREIVEWKNVKNCLRNARPL